MPPSTIILISIIIILLILLSQKHLAFSKAQSDLEAKYRELSAAHSFLTEEKEKIQAEIERLIGDKLSFDLSHNAVIGENKLLSLNNRKLSDEITRLLDEREKHEVSLKQLLSSNLEAMPWLAGMMADYITYDLEILARSLDWGWDKQRLKKVASIRDIRNSTKEQIAAAKLAIYQLEYLKTLYPSLDDVLSSDYKDLDFKRDQIPEYDPARDYLSKEEWNSLTDCQRNQLALDRYISSHKKSNWQIGRDYELFVAYRYSLKGYLVDTFGSYMQLEDLGRDLILTKGHEVRIVQCKYWAQHKEIHEKHLFQLYGTVVAYCIEHNISQSYVKGIFVTNITLSKMAKQFADYLGILVVENYAMGDFPRIKCNIGRNEFGTKQYIYHLPMDQQYDLVKIDQPGECYAFTVEEAESLGFRRAFKWHSI